MMSMIKFAVKSLLFAKGDPEKIRNMMAPGQIGVLSAKCCNPSALEKDEELMALLQKTLDEEQISTSVHCETITAAQKGLRQLSKELNDREKEIVNQLMGLFQSKGLSIFPVVLLDGQIASYGGIPTSDLLAEKLRPLKTASAA